MSCKILDVQVRYEIDKKIPVTFEIGVESTGEVLLAKVYDLETSTEVDDISPTPSVLGGAKGDTVTMVLDFTTVPPGENYSLVVSTAETGLIAKGALVVLLADGYSLPEPV